MANMMQECKVYFPVETTRDQAEAVIRRYAPKAVIDNFMERRLVGANEMTFAVVTLSVDESSRLVDNVRVIRVNVMQAFAAQRSAGCDGSGGCGSCQP